MIFSCWDIVFSDSVAMFFYSWHIIVIVPMFSPVMLLKNLFCRALVITADAPEGFFPYKIETMLSKHF